MAQVVINVDAHTPVSLVKGVFKIALWPLKQVNNVLLDTTDAALQLRRLERAEEAALKAEREMAEAVAAAAEEIAPVEETPQVRKGRPRKTASAEA
jgi:hypothetical protein